MINRAHKGDSIVGAERARQMLAKDKSYFTVQEMMDLIQTLDHEKIPESVRQQICQDVMTYPYYDCLAMWLETTEWIDNNRAYAVFSRLAERSRYTDLPALLRDRVYGKRFRDFIKSRRIPRPVRETIIARLALNEGLWRIKNPDHGNEAFRRFLMELLTKLESS